MRQTAYLSAALKGKPPLKRSVKAKGNKMTFILRLFQVTTVRAAWVFLGFSTLLFVFGVWQAVSVVFGPSEPFSNFHAVFFSAWLFITGVYSCLAGWVLFTPRGKDFLLSQRQGRNTRSALWYIKFLFAVCAAGFATTMFLSTLVLPFAGAAGFLTMVEPRGGIYVLLAGVLWAPLVFRHLK